MCGFAGTLRAGLEEGETRSRVSRAIHAIRHRGPDDGGYHFDPARDFGVGHVRLAIIDTTAAAHQPMASPDGRFVLVFNGEIYNYRELYAQYGHQLPGVNPNSDTSVLLGLLMKYGRECLAWLNGMFAFAVLDKGSGKLLLARDRFGEKPLYWSRPGAQRTVVFASELSALKALIGHHPPADVEAYALFHMLGSIPAPRTPYDGIHALEAGEWIQFAADGQLEKGTYWRFSDHISPDAGISNFDDAVADVRSHMRDAVRSRMVSDVPVGLFLSGGIDSGSIMAFCSEQSLPVASALCLDFEEPGFSEVALATKTATKHGLKLTTYLVSGREFVEQLPGFFASMDQPTCDGYNTYFVSRVARQQGIKVWLSGVGGDELFGGYPSFTRLPFLSRIAHLAHRFVPVSLGAGIARWYPQRIRAERLVHLFRDGDPRLRAYQTCRMPMSIESTRDVFAEAIRDCVDSKLIDSTYPDIPGQADDFQAASILEALVYMRSQLLRDIDNFSMAHSIELRAPFLDHRLCEAVLGIPARYRFRDGGKKELLVKSLGAQLPAEVVAARKAGFTFPVERWLRQELASHFIEVVLDSANADIWHMPTVERLWRQCERGHVHWSVLWSFYVLALWRAGARDESQ